MAVQQGYNKATQNHLNVVMNEGQRVCVSGGGGGG